MYRYRYILIVVIFRRSSPTVKKETRWKMTQCGADGYESLCASPVLPKTKTETTHLSLEIKQRNWKIFVTNSTASVTLSSRLCPGLNRSLSTPSETELQTSTKMKYSLGLYVPDIQAKKAVYCSGFYSFTSHLGRWVKNLFSDPVFDNIYQLLRVHIVIYTLRSHLKPTKTLKLISTS